jgi:hypothetical protein
MPARDKELEAISSIIDLLKRLDANERSRVLEYVLKRLEMGAVQIPSTVSELTSAAPPEHAARPKVSDIRTLIAEKQPRSTNEMVALIAYYVSELAPESEASQTVNLEIIRKYFKMARFPLPRAPQSALPNAAAAGYLENVSRGEYRLNPVGYNLVVHGLPRSNTAGPSGAVRPRIRKRGGRRPQ